jgi:hypothetical protein
MKSARRLIQIEFWRIKMANLKVMGALAVSAALAVATPAMAQHGGFHGGGGGGFHGGGGGGFHGGGGGGFGGGMRAGGGGGGGFRAAAVGGGAPRATIGGSSFRNANASVGAASPSFAGRAPVVAGGGGRNWNGGGWHNGGWRHGYRPGIGFAAGLAAGSALGYGYGGYYDDGYYADNGYYGDPYAYNDDYYAPGDSGYVVSSNDDSASCAQRYRSYDPASGTYLGYDGERHPCP